MNQSAKVFDAIVTNGAFWVRFAVVAECEQQARTLAENARKDNANRCAVRFIEESPVWEPQEMYCAVTMLDAGSEG